MTFDHSSDLSQTTVFPDVETYISKSSAFHMNENRIRDEYLIIYVFTSQPSETGR